MNHPKYPQYYHGNYASKSSPSGFPVFSDGSRAYFGLRRLQLHLQLYHLFPQGLKRDRTNQEDVGEDGSTQSPGWSIFQDKQLGRIEDCIESVVVPSFLLQTTKNIQNPTKIHMVLKITFHMKMSIQWEQDKSTCLPRKLNQPPWFEPVDAQLPRQSHLSYFCTRFGHLYPTYSHVVLCFKNKAPMNPQIGQFYMLYYQTIHWVGSIIVTHIQSNDLE